MSYQSQHDTPGRHALTVVGQASPYGSVDYLGPQQALVPTQHELPSAQQALTVRGTLPSDERFLGAHVYSAEMYAARRAAMAVKADAFLAAYTLKAVEAVEQVAFHSALQAQSVALAAVDNAPARLGDLGDQSLLEWAQRSRERNAITANAVWQRTQARRQKQGG